MNPSVPAEACLGTRYALKFLRQEASHDALIFSVTFPVLNSGTERWDAMLYFRLPTGSHDQGGGDAMQKAAGEFAREHRLDAPRFFRDVLTCLAETTGLAGASRSPESSSRCSEGKNTGGKTISSIFGRLDEEAMQ